MGRFWSMLWFQTKIYARNQYFLSLMLTSTVSMVLTLYLVNYANRTVDETLWIRAAIVGLWASATTAAGVISFQKNQQTLDIVLNQRVDEREALSILVLPAILFGSLAFPVSWIMTNILGLPIGFNWNQMIVGAMLLIVTAATMSLLISVLFVLTNDAIIYEQLIDIPIVLLAGVFGFPNGWGWLGRITRWLIPIAGPVRILTVGLSGLDVVASFISAGIWLVSAWLLASHLLQLAKRTGRFGTL